jgi:hypothetical protein
MFLFGILVTQSCLPHELQGADSKVQTKSFLYIRFKTNSIDAAILHYSAGDPCPCITTTSAIHRTPEPPQGVCRPQPEAKQTTVGEAAGDGGRLE